MKRISIIAIALMSMVIVTNVYAENVYVGWDYSAADQANVTGYALSFWETANPAAKWYTHIDDPAARQMLICPEEKFKANVEYTFALKAFNSLITDPSTDALATWTRVAEGYTPPADVLPTTDYPIPTTPPNEVQFIQIWRSNP